MGICEKITPAPSRYVKPSAADYCKKYRFAYGCPLQDPDNYDENCSLVYQNIGNYESVAAAYQCGPHVGNGQTPCPSGMNFNQCVPSGSGSYSEMAPSDKAMSFAADGPVEITITIDIGK